MHIFVPKESNNVKGRLLAGSQHPMVASRGVRSVKDNPEARPHKG
jgi:hypothetical protein